MKIGDIIFIGENEMKVVDIQIVLFLERSDGDISVGIYKYSTDGITPFDLSIVIIVDSVK